MGESRVVDMSDFDPMEEISSFTAQNDEGASGGLLFFVGVVRERSKDGKTVSGLEIESEKDIASRELRRIEEEIRTRFGLQDARIVHAEGVIEPGDAIVLVALAGESRKDILPAMRESIHLYKTRPLIFKKEVYEDGTGRWIEGD